MTFMQAAASVKEGSAVLRDVSSSMSALTGRTAAIVLSGGGKLRAGFRHQRILAKLCMLASASKKDTFLPEKINDVKELVSKRRSSI